MAEEILFDTEKLTGCAADIKALSSRVEETRTNVNQAINGLNWEVQSKAGIEEDVHLAFMKMRDQTEFLGFMTTAMGAVSDHLNGNFSGFMAKVAALIGMTGAGISYESWRNSVTSDYTVRIGEDGSYVYDTVYDDGDRAEMEANVADYSDWCTRDELQARYDKLYSKYGYVGDCTNLVNDQLKDQGIYLGAAMDNKGNRTGKATHMGKSYVRKRFAECTIDKADKNNGYYCDTYLIDYNNPGEERSMFSKMLSENPEPVKNIVLSFSPGSTYHVDETQGHTMLISKIENGKVYFTDNLRSNGGLKAPEPDGTGGKDIIGRLNCLTIEAFQSLYLDQFNCNGMAVIKHV